MYRCSRVKFLWRLARALDWQKDPNPEHWKTINGAKVHLDKNGNYDGGAGSKFNGRHHYGPDWRQKSALMNRLAVALHSGVNQKNVASQATNGNGSGQGSSNGSNLNTEEKARQNVAQLEKLCEKAHNECNHAWDLYWHNGRNPEDKKKYDEANAKYQEVQKNLEAARNEAAAKGILFISSAWNHIDLTIKNNHVTSLPVKHHTKKLSDDDIINRLAGGDKTKGSCSTLAFAYIANKCGLDVLDFRGGNSQDVFSRTSVIGNIGKLNGIKMKADYVKREASDGAKILLGLDKGKEYYFAIGRHAAIVKNTDEGLKYLELQSRYPERNGWQPMGNSLREVSAKLNDRFGATKSQRRVLRMPIMSQVFLMDVESFKGNKEFEKVTEYFNTNADQQKKGVEGDVK